MGTRSCLPLPLHSSLCCPAPLPQLARENNIQHTEVIRNGQMLGVADRRNARTVSVGSMNVLGEAPLTLLYNDGNKVGLGLGLRRGWDCRPEECVPVSAELL